MQNERGRQTWAALLLGMKRRLLNLHLLYQFPDPIKHSLIGYSGRNTPILLDLAVEFDAPFTHCIQPFRREQHGHLSLYYDGTAI